MKTTWTLNEKSNGELKVEISGDVWKEAQDKALAKLAKDVEVKGFRKGSVPLNIAKKSISEQNILVEAVESLGQAALDKGLEEQDLTPVSQPVFGVEAISAESVTVTFKFDVMGEIKLGSYKKLGIQKEVPAVSPDEVENKLTEMRSQYAELVLKEEGTVEDGDTAVIDFEGFKDGVAFEGGKGENYSLEIGSGTFIPGFEDSVIGMKSSEEKDIDVTFPENYQQPDLAGQAVVFKVKVNEIKSRHIPELDEDFIAELNQDGVSSVDELRAKVEHDLLHEKEHQVEDEYNNAILTAVVDNTELEIPASMIEQETDMMLQDFASRLSQQGFSLEQYSQITGQSSEELKSMMSIDAESKVRVRLVLDEIARQEKIEVSEDELESEYDALATQYQMEKDQIKSLASPSSITYDLRLRKAYDLIKAENE